MRALLFKNHKNRHSKLLFTSVNLQNAKLCHYKGLLKQAIDHSHRILSFQKIFPRN